MKKFLITLAILVLVLVFFVIQIADNGLLPQTQVNDQALTDLEQEIQELQARIDELEGQLAFYEASGGLSYWTLDVYAWPDSTGADVTLQATPAAFQDGMSASLLVLLDGQEMADVPCRWDGSAFCATASLPAADGYSYFCVLYPAEGATQQIALTSPESPSYPVYLAAGLSAYCNLLVDTWEETDGSLVLTAASAHVQLPRFSAQDTAIQSAQLVLSRNGEEIQRLDLTLEPSEVAGSFEQLLGGTRFPLPETADDDELTLHLEVALTTGLELLAPGVSWYRIDGALHSVVG